MNRPSFDLVREDRGDLTVLTVTGDVDVDTAWRLREELTTVLAERDTVMDLSGVAFLDSTGLGVLVAGYRQARRSGYRMALAGAPQRVLDLLDLTRLTTLFSLYPDVPSATSGLSADAHS